MDRKQQQPDLFRLIHSLSKSEKRYFKVYASRHVIDRENNYLKLFNAIERQKEYDEDALRRQFRHETFVRQLAVTKNYLHRLIMESMRIYHADKTPAAQVRSLIQDAEFYMERMFYPQCSRSLERAKKLIYEHELFLYLPEILHYERLMMTHEEYRGKTNESIDAFSAECRLALERIGNLAQYWDLSARLFLIYLHHGSTRTEDDLRTLKALIDHPLLQSEEAAQTFEAREYYYHIRGTYYFLQGDYANAHRYSRSHIELLEQQPDYVTHHTGRYLGRLSIYLLDSFKLRLYDEFFAGMEKIHNFRNLYPDVRGEKSEVELFKIRTMLDLYSCIELGDTERGLALVPEIEQGLERYHDRIEPSLVLSFRFNTASLFFIAGRYQDALDRTNALLNSGELDIREDIYGFLRLFNIMLHYELGNDSLLEHLLKSTYRYLYSRKKIYRYESVILRMIRKLATRRSKRELTAVFRELRDEMIPLASDPFERKAFECLDVIPWLDSKIEGKPLAAIIRRKAGIDTNQPTATVSTPDNSSGQAGS